MEIFTAIIYTTCMFKTFGIIAWFCCLLVLGYQGVYWILYASWPSVTLFDATQKLGIDLVYLVQSLSLEIAAKTAYICFTTELSLFFWWTGIALFALVFVSKVLLKK